MKDKQTYKGGEKCPKSGQYRVIVWLKTIDFFLHQMEKI